MRDLLVRRLAIRAGDEVEGEEIDPAGEAVLKRKVAKITARLQKKARKQKKRLHNQQQSTPAPSSTPVLPAVFDLDTAEYDIAGFSVPLGFRQSGQHASEFPIALLRLLYRHAAYHSQHPNWHGLPQKIDIKETCDWARLEYMLPPKLDGNLLRLQQLGHSVDAYQQPSVVVTFEAPSAHESAPKSAIPVANRAHSPELVAAIQRGRLPKIYARFGKNMAPEHQAVIEKTARRFGRDGRVKPGGLSTVHTHLYQLQHLAQYQPPDPLF